MSTRVTVSRVPRSSYNTYLYIVRKILHQLQLQGRRNRGEVGLPDPPILGLESIAPSILDDDRRKYFATLFLQVEIIVDGVAVDSLETHCHGHLCACCSGYFCHRLINGNPKILS